jgi:hypothetical protein
MEKTIKTLNERRWYRALKIIYFFLLITVILVANGSLIAEGIGKIDRNKTLIYCSEGDKRILTLKQAGIYFDSYAFWRGFNYKRFFENNNKYTINDILEACYDKPSEDIFLTQRTYEIIGLKDSPKEYDKSYLDNQIGMMENGYKTDDQKASYLDYSVKLFDVKLVYFYSEFFLSFIIANILILTIFEAVRRVLYYVVLGTIKPNKK